MRDGCHRLRDLGKRDGRLCLGRALGGLRRGVVGKRVFLGVDDARGTGRQGHQELAQPHALHRATDDAGQVAGRVGGGGRDDGVLALEHRQK